MQAALRRDAIHYPVVGLSWYLVHQLELEAHTQGERPPFSGRTQHPIEVSPSPSQSTTPEIEGHARHEQQVLGSERHALLPRRRNQHTVALRDEVLPPPAGGELQPASADRPWPEENLSARPGDLVQGTRRKLVRKRCVENHSRSLAELGRFRESLRDPLARGPDLIGLEQPTPRRYQIPQLPLPGPDLQWVVGAVSAMAVSTRVINSWR